MTARDRHPGEHRFHQVDQLSAGPILRLRSLGALCSLRHRRLLGPRCWGRCLGRRDSHADQGAVATQFSSSTGTGTSPRNEEMAMERGELAGLVVQFTEAFNREDLDGVMSFMAEDAVYDEFNGTINRGTAAIRAAFEPQFR